MVNDRYNDQFLARLISLSVYEYDKKCNYELIKKYNEQKDGEQNETNHKD